MNWIETTIDKLPEPFKMVALMNLDSRQNIGNIEDHFPVCRVGFLNDSFGSPFWSCYGERGINLEYFTHWCALPQFENLNCF